MKFIVNLIDKIKYGVLRKYYRFCEERFARKCKKKYPDYEDNEYNYGSLKHIWGVKSWDDLSGSGCNLHTMNDIDITFDRDTGTYSLGVETIYMFNEPSNINECKYLRRLLDAFTKFMDDNALNKESNINLLCRNVGLSTSADSIEDLYTNFRIFVEGYCKICGYEGD